MPILLQFEQTEFELSDTAQKLQIKEEININIFISSTNISFLFSLKKITCQVTMSNLTNCLLRTWPVLDPEVCYE